MCAFFNHFFNRFKISVKFCVFGMFFIGNIFFVILALLKILKPNAQKTAQNSKNVFGKCVLDFNLHPSKGLYSSFTKKSQIHCTLCTQIFLHRKLITFPKIKQPLSFKISDFPIHNLLLLTCLFLTQNLSE